MLPVSIDYRVAICRDDFDVLKADLTQMIGQPCGTFLQVLSVIGLSTDCRKSDKIFQLMQEPIAMLSGIFEGARRVHKFIAIRAEVSLSSASYSSCKASPA